EKANPTAQYLTTFDDSRLRTVDTRGYATLKYAHQFSDTLDASADVYYDRSDFQIGQPYPNYFEKEQETGAWAGGEAQVNKRLWNRHLLTVGGEFRDDFSQDAHVHVSGQGLAPSDTYYRDRRQNFGVFAQDDLAVLTNLHVNAGVRYDQYYDRQLDFAPAWSPRAAIIYDAFSESTFKLIYGTAFRDPSFYELSELPTLSTKPNPEKITTYEADYEQGIGLHWRSSISAFYNRMDDLIVFAPDGSFTNFNAGSLGAELALEGIWEDGIRTRISYTLQHTENRDTGGGLPDSPAHLIKANVSVPLWEDKIFAGLEFQYASSSHTIMTVQNLNTGNFITQPGPDAPGFAVVNLTLYSHNLVKNLDASVSLYNLLDHRYEEPATRFHLQNVIPQDGLAFRVKLTYHF
ncbi:MAG: TonB-dependent receptor, partial [Verrucomicrobiota bacterium]|nr:TonB-dependent receptor [Verrucomicrobiota bacterium]